MERGRFEAAEGDRARRRADRDEMPGAWLHYVDQEPYATLIDGKRRETRRVESRGLRGT